MKRHACTSQRPKLMPRAQRSSHLARKVGAFAVIAVVAAMLAVLAGCAQEEEPGQQTPAYEELSGTVTMADYMRERYAGFDEYAQAIHEGTFAPGRLHLILADGTEGYVEDPEDMARLWDELCQIRVDLDHPAHPEVDGNIIAFDFDSGRGVIPFTFCTNEYADFSGADYYPVEDPAEVDGLVEECSAIMIKAQREPDENGEIPFEDGAYYWDADGDSKAEHMWVDFVDNGDEAPSVLVLRVFNNDGLDVTGYIDMGYSFEHAYAMEDDQGPYLVVTYQAGDYYSHDVEKQCMVRLVDDELVVEDVD